MLRIARNMTQRDVAKHCQVTPAAVSAWELGETENVRLATFMRLVECLGTDFAYLIYGISRRPPTAVANGQAHAQPNHATIPNQDTSSLAEIVEGLPSRPISRGRRKHRDS